MTFSRWPRWSAAGILIGIGLFGCMPDGSGRSDEEHEPHFLMGRKLAGQMDYEGAVNAYEKALEVNPESASAHFELAWLYEGKENDPAAAIYHYERFLKLAPGSGKAEVAQAHINNCKLALAESASAIAPISASAQRDLDRLLQENRDLKSQLAQWQAYYQSHPVLTPSNPPAVVAVSNPVAPQLPSPARPRPQEKPSAATAISASPADAPVTARAHTVKPGDTLAAIAREHGVSLASLEAANPQVSPTHLHVGSTVNLPSP